MIFNMVGGGGGGLKDTDAVLIVTVSTGSTVTATKGGVTITPTIWVQNADNTLDTAIFSIKASTFDANAWTVTATLGTDSASDTVTIDSAEEYELFLEFNTWLFKNGDENTSLTGGWGTTTWSTSWWKFGTYTNTGTVMLLQSQSTQTNACVSINTVNAVDVTDYSTMSLTVVSNNFETFRFGIQSSRGVGLEASNFVVSGDGSSAGVYSIDLTATTGTYYPSIKVWGNNTPANTTAQFNYVYLK